MPAELCIGLVRTSFAAHLRTRATGRIGQGIEAAVGRGRDARVTAAVTWLLQESLRCATQRVHQIAADIQKVAEGVKDHAHIS